MNLLKSNGAAQNKIPQAWVCLLALCIASGAQAACPSVSGRFIAKGDTVIDSKTNLVWARCSVGQTWDGATCMGASSDFTHEEAMIHVKNQNGWRLPNVREMRSIVDKGCADPAIDGTTFPATIFVPPGSVIPTVIGARRRWYWTSTPSLPGGSSVQVVRFHDGSVAGGSRKDRGVVRLVRASP